MKDIESEMDEIEKEITFTIKSLNGEEEQIQTLEQKKKLQRASKHKQAK